MISQKRCGYYNRAALIRVRKLIQPLLYYSICFPANLPSLMLNADRIVGGQDASSEIPWQVSVRAGMDTNLQGTHWCGGTILDAKTILSAAHCFFAGPNLGNSGKEFVNVLNPFIKAGITDVDASNAQVFFYEIILLFYFLFLKYFCAGWGNRKICVEYGK